MQFGEHARPLYRQKKGPFSMKTSYMLAIWALRFQIASAWRFSIWGTCYAAPIGASFCPKIRASTGFWGEISSTASKVLSDRKVLFKHKNGR